MGKETKIGLGIIAVLGVIFAAVLVQRLTGSKDAEVAADQTQPSTSSKSPADKKHEGDAGERPLSPKTPTFSQPTVIAPKPGPNRHDGRRDSPWAVVSDDGKSGTASSPPSPLSFMPTPESTSPANSPGSTPAPMPGHRPLPPGSVSTLPAPPPSSRDLFLPPEHSDSTADRTPVGSPPPGYASAYPESTNPTSDMTSRGPDYPRQRGHDGASPTPRPSQGQAMYPTQPGNAEVSQDPYQSAPVAQKTARQFGFEGGPPRHHGGGSAVEGGNATARPDGDYVVQPNDSFWVISKNLYGSGAYFKALAEYNRAKYRPEDTLRVGDTIKAPEVSELEAKYPDLCPSPERRQAVRQRASTVRNASTRLAGERVYTVEDGDTLYDIARYKLGKGSRWPEIYELNRDALQDNFDYLTPGMKLLLPETSKGTGTVTQRSDAFNRK